MIRDLVEKSRSFRGYDPSYRLTEPDLLELVDCARLTPSAMNRQPLKYYLAWEQEETAAIQQVTLPHAGHYPPAFIVICQDIQISASLNAFLKDVGIAAQTMLLAAAEKGLGGCMVGNFVPESIRAVSYTHLDVYKRQVLMTARVHPFPFRTRKLSSHVLTILGW